MGGIGGTLAGNALSLAAIRATLTEVLTDEAFARMIPLAERFEAGVDGVLRGADVPWHVTRLGARGEYHFMPELPRNGSDQAAHDDGELERFLHLWAMNRGVLMTPFHNMALMSPGHDRGRRRPPHRRVRGGGRGAVRVGRRGPATRIRRVRGQATRRRASARARKRPSPATRSAIETDTPTGTPESAVSVTAVFSPAGLGAPGRGVALGVGRGGRGVAGDAGRIRVGPLPGRLGERGSAGCKRGRGGSQEVVGRGALGAGVLDRRSDRAEGPRFRRSRGCPPSGAAPRPRGSRGRSRGAGRSIAAPPARRRTRRHPDGRRRAVSSTVRR